MDSIADYLENFLRSASFHSLPDEPWFRHKLHLMVSEEKGWRIKLHDPEPTNALCSSWGDVKFFRTMVTSRKAIPDEIKGSQKP